MMHLAWPASHNLFSNLGLRNQPGAGLHCRSRNGQPILFLSIEGDNFYYPIDLAFRDAKSVFAAQDENDLRIELWSRPGCKTRYPQGGVLKAHEQAYRKQNLKYCGNWCVRCHSSQTACPCGTRHGFMLLLLHSVV